MHDPIFLKNIPDIIDLVQKVSEVWVIHEKILPLMERKKKQEKILYYSQREIRKLCHMLSADSSNFDHNFRMNFKMKLYFPGSDKLGISVFFKHDFS